METAIFFGGAFLFFAWMYNSLIHVKNEVENAVGAVHAVLQKRSDLVPNLVATLNQYDSYESNLLKELTEARTLIQSSLVKTRGPRTAGGADLIAADQKLTGALSQVFAVAENYPDLKSNQNYLALMASLNDVEAHLAAARRSYNAAAVRYNTAIESIPTVFLARALGYLKKPVFAVDSKTAQNPDVASLFSRRTAG